jgi:hypothetical protein
VHPPGGTSSFHRRGDITQKDGVNFGAISSAINENDTRASSANRPSKGAKKDDGGVDFLVQAFAQIK